MKAPQFTISRHCRTYCVMTEQGADYTVGYAATVPALPGAKLFYHVRAVRDGSDQGYAEIHRLSCARTGLAAFDGLSPADLHRGITIRLAEYGPEFILQLMQNAPTL